MQPYQGRSPIINVTSNACVFAGKKLLRDFLEIENLQVTKKDISRFYNNAILNVEKNIRQSLLKARPDWHINPSKIENQTDAWIINVLSGKENFLHGIPHVAISIASYNNGKLSSGCIYDPLRKELFFSELGKGAYLNERRIRVSGRSLLNKSLISPNFRNTSLFSSTSLIFFSASVIRFCKLVSEEKIFKNFPLSSS